jgi:Domain of unknown function (DUF6265)
MRLAPLLLALSLSTAALAAETRSLAPGAAPAVASIADFAWMAGAWQGQGLGGQVLESYSPPAGGQMPGHFRMVKDGEVGFYELVALAQVGNSVEYRVKHFNADMTGWEEKAQVVRFPLVAAEKDVWFFDRLTIRRAGADRAVHVVRISNKDGSEREVSFTYDRVKP